MKTYVWVALGLFSLITITAYAPSTEAVDFNHAAISKTVIKETERVYGPDAASRVVAWNDLVMNCKNKPVIEKLALTNNFFNRIPIKSDIEIWGHAHWSTPFEMLTRNAGSHADHVIGKYVTLEALGVSLDHLQLTHVHSTATPDQAYMVLTYRSEPTAMPLVLDTVNDEIKPANERDDLFPQDSFNESGLWRSKDQKDGRNDAQTEAAAHIELWNEMNARMNQEILSAKNPSSPFKANIQTLETLKSGSPSKN